MPINQYFNHYNATNEQNLYEDLLVELIQMNGQMIHYIPKQFNKLDTIFGEDVLMSFDRTYQIEMYFNTPNGFEGDRYMLSKLGYTMPKQANFIVSRRLVLMKYGDMKVPSILKILISHLMLK